MKKNLRYNYVHVYVCRLVSDRNMSVLLKMKVLILEKLHTKYVYNIIVLRVCIIIIKLTLWGQTPLRREVLDTTLSVKSLSVTCGKLVVSSTNKTDHHDITEILLKVALSTIAVTLTPWLLKDAYYRGRRQMYL